MGLTILPPPPSPLSREVHQEEDYYPSPRASVVSLSSQTSSTSSGFASLDVDMGKASPCVEIILDSPIVFLKGTGVDVEPARLSGHVVLHLSESTSVKELTLSFRGKSRLPTFNTDAMSFNSSYVQHVICEHDWSFLEGDKKHTRTLKAGRHCFPFQLQIGGSLPSTLSTTIFGGAAVTYKLRAELIRPRLTQNIYSTLPVTVLRSFAPEALEYQQTLEIENTWPEKLMYSIMLPHKAWAAGDNVTAIVKFSPLKKGVCVLTVGTAIHEITKINNKGGTPAEYSRVIATKKHEIVGGRAVEMDPFGRRDPVSSNPSNSTTPAAATSQPPGAAGGSALPHRVAMNLRPSSSHSFSSTTCTPRPPFTTSSSPLAGPSSSPSTSTPRQNSQASTSSASASNSTSAQAPDSAGVDEIADDLEGLDDTIAPLEIAVPLNLTPTHPLDPIIVSHRIKWSIIILNPDGHTSELRCSLPLHLLDYRLLEEARALTATTRRLMLGGPEVPLEEDDHELPSYKAHVRDRVANMFLPETATVRVANPWSAASGTTSANGSRPTTPNVAGATRLSVPSSSSLGVGFFSRGRSRPGTPNNQSNSQLPHVPDSSTLEWLNAELLYANSNTQTSQARSGPPPDSEPASRRSSRFPSRNGSRAASRSRNGSPERPDVTIVHEPPNGRGSHMLLEATLKAFTPMARSWFSSRSAAAPSSSSSTSSSQPHPASVALSSIANPQSNPYMSSTSYGVTPTFIGSSHTLQASTSRPSSSGGVNVGLAGPSFYIGNGSQSPPSSRPGTSSSRISNIESIGLDQHLTSALLQRAYTEVPTYGVASRGFIGGVPPLESLQGLPSYEESLMATRKKKTSGRRRSRSGAGGSESLSGSGDGAEEWKTIEREMMRRRNEGVGAGASGSVSAREERRVAFAVGS